MNRRKFFKFTAGAIALLAIPLPLLAKRVSDVYEVKTGDWFYINSSSGRDSMVTVYNKNHEIVDGPRPVYTDDSPPRITPALKILPRQGPVLTWNRVP